MGNQDYQVPTTMSVFGNAATTPANLTTSNARIEALRQNLANAQAQLAQANNSGNNTQQSIQDRLYDYYMNEYRNTKPTSVAAVVHKEMFGDDLYKKQAQQQAAKEAKKIAAWYGGDATTSAQNAVNTAQEKLNNALARQQMQIQAGQDAVNWGQTAMNAEQQGIANAAQMYQQAMQGEAIRNAIMNNAIGTVGFGGGK